MADVPVPPDDVLDALSVAPPDLHPVGRTNVWLVTRHGGFVLRAHPTPRLDGAASETSYRLSGLAALAIAGLPQSSGDPATRVEEGVAWVHEVLRRLAAIAPVPEPVPLLDGTTFLRRGDIIWETLSLLPGEVVADRHPPDLGELGAFLAHYHVGAATISVPERPAATPIDRLGAVVDWSHATATMQRANGRELLRTLIDAVDDELRGLGHGQLRRCVVHGDPTTHNILASGDPPHPCGLIDFDLAYHDPPAADVAFAMWRSGRPSPGVGRVDPRRLRAFVAGYVTVRPLSDVERAVIPVYLRARGLQMLAKRTRLGIIDSGPLEQVRWIEAHQDELAQALDGD